MESGEFYIGVTQGYRQKDLRVRVLKHFQRAVTESKTWNLCTNIRTYGSEAFTWAILEIVRGKAAAHARERELTKELGPTLNTQ